MRPIGASVHVCGSRRARHRHNDFGPVGASGYVSGPDEWRACVCLGARLARQSMSRGPNGAAFTGLCMSRGPNGAAVYVSGPYWRVCQCPGARMAHLSMSRGPIGASRGTELKGLAGVRTRPRRGAGAAGRGAGAAGPVFQSWRPFGPALARPLLASEAASEVGPPEGPGARMFRPLSACSHDLRREMES